MKTIIFIPSQCKKKEIEENGVKKEVEPEFSGEIILRMPNFDERFALFEEVGMDPNQSKDELSPLKHVGTIRKLVAKSKEFYQEGSVKIKRLADGLELKSFDDLSYEPDCALILIEAASALISGASVSKNLKP